MGARRSLTVLTVVLLAAGLLIGAAGTAGAIPPSLDGDGDGWYNPTETLLGSDAGDPFKTPESFAIPGSCMDAADNDGDGATDDADPGCHPVPVIDGTFPPAGFDVFESDMDVNGLTLETPLGDCEIDFEGVGPTVVRRGNPATNSGGMREIDVEIVSMQLTGTANLVPGTPCNGSQRVAGVPVTLMEDPAKASSGKVTAKQSSADFPADSFFDVNFVVDSPLGLLPGTLRVTNDSINTLPPFHTPNDPGKNPDCYDFGGVHEHCPKPPLDHFLCYSGDFPRPDPQAVRLVLDQFFGRPARVAEPNAFCNAVRKNRLPIFDRNAHLQFHRIEVPGENPVAGSPVVVRNQFGTQTFQVGDRVALAVPTRKNQQDPPLALDHYACYQIQGNQLNRPVALQDQFGNMNTVVSRPQLLCNPAVKVHNRQITRVQDKRWHLVCYAIQPTPFNLTTVTTRNQFGSSTVVARQPVSLCVPSQKFIEHRPFIPHSFGFQDPATGRWHLRGLDGQETSFFFGNPGDVPFMGDWDCDGVDTPGLYRSSDGFVYLRNSNDAGFADVEFFFGNPGDVPLPGDFNQDGCDTVSLFRPSIQTMFVINKLGSRATGLGAADFSFLFGNPGDKPVIGDWDGDGTDELGLHRESTGFFYYRNSLDTGIASDEIFFGDPGDRFVAGDWGVVDGKDTPAVYRPANQTFFQRDTLTQGVADDQFGFGADRQGFIPVAGVFADGFESGDVTR